MLKERIASISAVAVILIERYFAYLDHKATMKASALSYSTLLEMATRMCQ